MSIFKIRYEKLGGHIHMSLFSAKQSNFTFTKLGDLCCHEDEFDDLQRAMAGVSFVRKEAEDG